MLVSRPISIVVLNGGYGYPFTYVLNSRFSILLDIPSSFTNNWTTRSSPVSKFFAGCVFTHSFIQTALQSSSSFKAQRNTSSWSLQPSVCQRDKDPVYRCLSKFPLYSRTSNNHARGKTLNTRSPAPSAKSDRYVCLPVLSRQMFYFLFLWRVWRVVCAYADQCGFEVEQVKQV